MPANLSTLTALAQAATFSPWEARFDPEEVTLGGQKRQWQVYGKLKGFGIARHICQCGNWTELGENSEKNAAFIAACDPQTILALVARVRELEQAVREQNPAVILDSSVSVLLVESLREENKKLVARVRTLEEALELVLPLAKGYAYEHSVGANQRYVEQAKRVLSGLDAAPSEPRDG